MIRRLRNIPNIIFETDNLILLVIGIAVGLGAALLYPSLQPYTDDVPIVGEALSSITDIGNVRCSNLAAPQGGYQRSLLSLAGNPGEVPDLKIDVAINQATLAQGDALEVRVIFTNNDAGPVVVFIPENNLLVANSPAQAGIRLEFLNIVSGQTLTYAIPTTAVPNAPTFRDTQIHLLRSHNQCSEVYELDVPLGIGEYSLRAFYANNNPGQLIVEANATPDPGITNQGVWASPDPIESESLRLSVVPPPTPTVAAPAQ